MADATPIPPFSSSVSLNSGMIPGNSTYGAAAAISADGNVAVIGAPDDNGSVGAVWVFTRTYDTNPDGAWSQPQKIVANGMTGQGRFGRSVALSWDGKTLAVGSPFASQNAGTIWIFNRVGATWTQIAALAAQGSFWLGSSVAISADGDIVLGGQVPATNQPGGTAWIFWLDDKGVWQSGVPLNLPASVANSGFGLSVALSADGDIALVGAPRLQGGLGAVYAYSGDLSKTPPDWSAPPTQVPAPNDLPGPTGFGAAIALSADGATAVIGNYGNGLDLSANAMWIYTANDAGAWTQLQPKFGPFNTPFGPSLAINAAGTLALVSSWDDNYGTQGLLFAQSGSGNWAALPNKLSGTVSGMGDYVGSMSIALSADGHTPLLGSAGAGLNTPQGAWVFENGTRVISHVFVLMLENHSFDNVFGYSGIDGIQTSVSTATNSWNGISYSASKGAPTNMSTDPGHEFLDIVEQLCGHNHKGFSGGSYTNPIDNSGFVSNYATSTTEIFHPGNPALPTASHYGDIMRCFDTPNQLPVIWTLAKQFALCDHWFSSLPGPTFPNRLFLYGGSSVGLADNPSALWSLPSMGFTYPNGSIFDSLKKQGVVYRIYFDEAINQVTPPMVGLIKGIQWPVNIHNFNAGLLPWTGFANDVQDPHYPEGYTFIEPNYGSVLTQSFMGGSSQHPMSGMHDGEKLIKDIYEAIRRSPHWNTSLFIITYDEHGGFFDSLRPGPPGTAIPPGDGVGHASTTRFNFDMYGVRVPAVVVSPLIPAGTVSHTVYDHTSVLATLQSIFGMSSLTNRDRAAKSVLDLLSRSVPRTDCPMTLPDAVADTPVTPVVAAAETEAAGGVRQNAALPAAGNVHGFLTILAKTEFELGDGSEASRAAIIAKVSGIRTAGEAEAYAEHVAALVRAVRTSKNG